MYMYYSNMPLLIGGIDGRVELTIYIYSFIHASFNLCNLIKFIIEFYHMEIHCCGAKTVMCMLTMYIIYGE